MLLRRLASILTMFVVWIVCASSSAYAQGALGTETQDSLQPRVLGPARTAQGQDVIRLRAAVGGTSLERVGYLGLFQLASQQMLASQRNRPQGERETLTEEAFANANPCDLMYVCRIPRNRATGRAYRQFFLLNGRQSDGRACAYNRNNFSDVGNEFVSRSYFDAYCTRQGGVYYETWDRPREIYDVPTHITPTARENAEAALREVAAMTHGSLETLAHDATPHLQTVLMGREATVDPATAPQVQQALRASITILQRLAQANAPATVTEPRAHEPASAALASAEEQNRRLSSQLNEERLARRREQVEASERLRDARMIAFFVLAALAVIGFVLFRHRTREVHAFKKTVFGGAVRSSQSIEDRIAQLLDYEVLVTEIDGMWNKLGRTLVSYQDKNQLPAQEERNLFTQTYGVFNVMNMRAAFADMRMCLEARLSPTTGRVATPFVAASDIVRLDNPNRAKKSNGNLIADEANAKEVADLQERLRVCQKEVATLTKEVGELRTDRVDLRVSLDQRDTQLAKLQKALVEKTTLIKALEENAKLSISDERAKQLVKEHEDLTKANRSLSQKNVTLTEQLGEQAKRAAEGAKVALEQHAVVFRAGGRIVKRFEVFLGKYSSALLDEERAELVNLVEELIGDLKQMEKPEVRTEEQVPSSVVRSTIPAPGLVPVPRKDTPGSFPAVPVPKVVVQEDPLDADTTLAYHVPVTPNGGAPISAGRSKGGTSDSGVHPAVPKNPALTKVAEEDFWGPDEKTAVDTVAAPAPPVKIPSIPPQGGSKGN